MECDRPGVTVEEGERGQEEEGWCKKEVWEEGMPRVMDVSAGGQRGRKKLIETERNKGEEPSSPARPRICLPAQSAGKRLLVDAQWNEAYSHRS